MVFLELELT